MKKEWCINCAIFLYINKASVGFGSLNIRESIVLDFTSQQLRLVPSGLGMLRHFYVLVQLS